MPRVSALHSPHWNSLIRSDEAEHVRVCAVCMYVLTSGATEMDKRDRDGRQFKERGRYNSLKATQVITDSSR